jgi:hypothetical protein
MNCLKEKFIIPSLLAAVIAFSSPTSATEPTDQSTKILLEWATSLENSINDGDPIIFTKSFNAEAVVNGAFKGLDIKESDRTSFLAGFKNGLSKTSPGQQFCNATSNLGRFTFLGLSNTDKGFVALFRSSSKQDFDYFDMYVSINQTGAVYITDMFFYSSAESYTQKVRLIGYSLAQSRSGQNTRMDPNLSVWLGAAPLIKAAFYDLQNGRFQQALERYAKLPKPLQKDKSILVNRLIAAAEVSKDEYTKAINDFAELYPGEPALNMQLVRWFIKKKQYDRARESIDKIERTVGKDAFLIYLRAELCFDEGELTKAKRLSKDATKIDSKLPQPQWLLLRIALQEGDFKESARLLKNLDRFWEVVLLDIKNSPSYEKFVKTTEFKALTENRAKP